MADAAIATVEIPRQMQLRRFMTTSIALRRPPLSNCDYVPFRLLASPTGRHQMTKGLAMGEGRGPGRPKGSLSPEISATILATATELFFAEGFDAVSMEKVARSAGIPKTTLYKRYADKKALLREVIEGRREKWSQEAREGDWKLGPDLRGRLTHYAELVLAWARSAEVRAVTALAVAGWSRPEEAPSRLELIGMSGMLDRLEADIVAFSPKMGLDRQAARRIAMHLMSTLAGWLEIRGAAAPSDEEAAAFAEDTVLLLMDGVAAW